MPAPAATKTEQGWISTQCFRLFREKHTSLSRLYWLTQLGNAATLNQIKRMPGNSYVVDAINVPFKRAMLPETCAEFSAKLQDREGVSRLHLLVICSANLESYLQDAIRLFVGAKGHARSNRVLDEVGDALARPVLRSSTVPEMLKYIEALLQVKFGAALETWKLGYKLRCAAAHNGGLATAKVKREVSPFKVEIGKLITLSWADLMKFLGAADDAASIIDRKISTKEVRGLEARWILDELKEANLLPPRDQVWEYLHTNYQIQGLKQLKKSIESLVY